MKHVLSLFVLCTIALPAFSEDSFAKFTKSGNAFLSTCSVIDKDSSKLTDIEAIQVAACTEFIEGLIQGVELESYYVGSIYAIPSGNAPTPICMPLPTEVTNGQIIRISLKFIRENPDKAHMQTAGLVALALKGAFTCSAK